MCVFAIYFTSVTVGYVRRKLLTPDRLHCVYIIGLIKHIEQSGWENINTSQIPSQGNDDMKSVHSSTHSVSCLIFAHGLAVGSRCFALVVVIFKVYICIYTRYYNTRTRMSLKLIRQDLNYYNRASHQTLGPSLRGESLTPKSVISPNRRNWLPNWWFLIDQHRESH